MYIFLLNIGSNDKNKRKSKVLPKIDNIEGITK